MREGSRSVWGKVQYATQLADGVWSVTTSSHGGIKLDAERNRKIPRAARREGGWYEEDCDWAIPAYVHADVEAAMFAPDNGRRRIVNCLKQYQTPEALEALGVS